MGEETLGGGFRSLLRRRSSAAWRDDVGKRHYCPARRIPRMVQTHCIARGKYHLISDRAAKVLNLVTPL